ncbi:MAG: tetratricopeptide repeat protein [Bacteroidota bacterium]
MTIRQFHIYAAIGFAVVHSGCAVYDPIADYTKQRYTNVVSYFNTYYNAQRLFSDAESEVLKARRELLERGSTTKALTIPATARQKFQASIEKNSKVLSFYPDSKWVDDALLMIGESYFYMEDDVRAERKFLELATQFPHSELIPESQLWLGKSLLRQKKTEEGMKQLEDVYAKTVDGDDELAGQSAYEMGQYYFARQEYSLAEKQYSLAAEKVSDDELKTQIYSQIGKCFSALQQYEKAEEAFSRAAQVSPVYALLFQARLQQVKSIAYQKKYDEALQSLQDMLRDSKNKEFNGIIHFETANILNLSGNTAAAVEKFRYVDTTFARSDEAARSYFFLGTYYENTALMYDSARVMYNKAKVEFSGSEITAMATSRADMFNKYAALKKDLFRFDSLYIYEAFRTEQSDSIARAAKDTLVKKDTLLVREETQSKKNVKSVAAQSVKDSIAVLDSLRQKERLNREQQRKTMLDSLQRSIIRTKFELGGLFYLEIQQPDSAIAWLNDVVRNYPKNQFAPRALYTIAEIYRTVQKRSATELESVYQEIISAYPESPYANEARKSIGIPVVITEKDTAQMLFESAEIMSESSNYDASIRACKIIAEKFPGSQVAPKALYTAGWHYENSLKNNDSAYAVYQRLIAAYPASTFAAAVRAKVTEVENERKRIEQEKQSEIEAQKIKEQQEKAQQEKEVQEKETKTGKEKKVEPVTTDSLSIPKMKL